MLLLTLGMRRGFHLGMIGQSRRQILRLGGEHDVVSVAEDEHCGVDGWLAVLSGQRIWPRSYDQLVESVPLATVRRALDVMASEIRAGAAKLPSHRDFIELRGAGAPA